MSWLDNWRRDKELTAYVNRVSGLLAGVAGNAPAVSKGSLSVGQLHVQDGGLKKQGPYLLTATRLVYVVTMEGNAYGTGVSFLHNRARTGLDDLAPEVIDLAEVRSFRNLPETMQSHGHVELMLADGTAVELSFLPSNVVGPRLTQAVNEAQGFLCSAAQAFGAVDLDGDREVPG